MKILRYPVLASLFALLIGCVSVNIQSNVKYDAMPSFKRILIVSRFSATSPDYLPKFQAAFPSAYQVCSIADSPIAFESADELIKRQAEVCKSEVILTLGFNRNYTAGDGKYISSYNEVYAEMSSLATGKPFWKAIITTSGSDEVPPRQVVNQLLKDGVIEGKLPSAYSQQVAD